MTMILWTMALVCWGISALLVALIVDPDFLHMHHRAQGGEHE